MPQDHRRERSRSRDRNDGHYGPGGGGGEGFGGMMMQHQHQQPGMSGMTMPQVVLPVATSNVLFSAQQAAQDKINRELFVGNTPPGTSELLLLHFLNGAMRRVGLCGQNETPILNCRVNTKFAFIELVHSDMANRALSLNGIPFLNAVLKISRPSKYTGPTVPSKTWQQLTGQSLPAGAAMDAEQEKVNRELFVGNTTPEMTESMLKEFLGNALQQVGLNIMSGNPITSCRVSGKFAFIELRTPQEAANALNLNQIPFLGTQLRVGRPSKWNGPPDHHGNWEDILAKYMSGELQLGESAATAAAPAALEASTATASAAAAATEAPATRVVELKNMVTTDDLENDEEYQEILEDTREECSQFGQLVSVVIPRANEVGATKIFLEYTSTADAQKAIGGLRGRTFDGRKVTAEYFDETKFAQKDYS